jgi:O-Antigen ligase
MIFLYLITLIISPQLWIEPFVGIRVDIIIYPLWFLIVLISGKMNEFFNFKVLDKFILFFIAWVALSAILNDSNEFTTQLIVDYIKWFVLYRLIIVTVDDFDGLIKSIHKLLFLIYIIVLEGFQHKHSDDGIGWAGQGLGWVDQSVLDAGGTGRLQWINIFDGPGVFCVMYTLALPFVIQFFDKHYAFKTKFIALVAVIPLFFAIFYTGSRGGLLATLGILTLYIVIRMAKKYGISITHLILGGALVSSALMLAPSHMTSVKDENNSAQHRVDMWMDGVDMVRENPLFGIGRGNYSIYTGTLIAHNSAIEIMGETGLVGLFFWIAMYYISFKHLYIFSVTSTNEVYISYTKGIVLSVIGYLISSMFVTLEYETLYLLFAFCAVVGKLHKQELKLTFNDYLIITGITLGWVFIVKVFVSLYY